MSDTEANIEDGPAMRALATDRQRGFVRALFDAPSKDGRVIWAARVAGYGTETSSNKFLSTIGARLHTSGPIQAAIAEHSRAFCEACHRPPSGLWRICWRIPSISDHARGIAMILDRSDPVQTTHNVVVDHKSDREVVAATKEVIARIHELAQRAGIKELPPPIDAEFSVVSEGAAP